MGLDAKVGMSKEYIEDLMSDVYEKPYNFMALCEECATAAGHPEWKYPDNYPVGKERYHASYGSLMTLRWAAFQVDGLVDAQDNSNIMQKFEEVWNQSSYKHLCEHSDCDGIYLPIDFDQPIFEPVSCGSSIRLKKELEDLKEKLIARGDDINGVPLWALDMLYKVTCESIELNTPVVFS